MNALDIGASLPGETRHPRPTSTRRKDACHRALALAHPFKTSFPEQHELGVGMSSKPATVRVPGLSDRLVSEMCLSPSSAAWPAPAQTY